MNSLLADLQREREERARSSPKAGEGTASGGHVTSAQDRQEEDQACTRKRKQSAPQRRIRDESGDAPVDEAEAGVGAGSKNPTGEGTKPKDPAKKRAQRASLKPAASEGEFEGDFDAESMASTLTSGGIFAGRDSRGEVQLDPLALKPLLWIKTSHFQGCALDARRMM